MGKFDDHLREIEEAKLELKKAQERIMVNALVLSARAKMENKSVELQSEFEAMVSELGQATKALATSISPVLKGLAGDAVQSRIERLSLPKLENLIR